MRFKVIILGITILISIFSFGCGGSETPSANLPNTNAPITNQPTTNTNTTIETNVNNQIQTQTTPEIATTNEAPTLSTVYKAYCEAMNKKNDAAVRKVFSQDTLKSLEKDMKDDNKTSITEFLSEMEPIKDVSKCGVRNEKIDGNIGVAEIRNENVPNGFKVKFVKENGEWKITTESPEFEKK
jgi:hypothetical protein